MNILGILATIIFSLGVIGLRRPYAALALLASALYITQGQAFEVAGINITAIRIVELAAFIRATIGVRGRLERLTSVDRFLLVFFTTYLAIIFARVGTLDQYSIGLATDGMLVFFAFRALITTPEEFFLFIKKTPLVLFPFAFLMVIEAITGKNLFSIMGGVPETPILREGYYRCQGSFRHAITAGTVGASFLPLFASVLFQRINVILPTIGLLASIAIVVASHSSGPLLAAIIGIIAWCCWPIRQHMRLVRWLILISLVILDIMMKAPVWFLFDRISGIIGGDGWHRANLIDKFIKNFSDWYLIGMPMEKTVGWAATVTKFGYTDITNYYISIGINGGLISLAAFILMLISCFKMVGMGLKSLQNEELKTIKFEYLLWGLGSVVLVHVVNLLSVSYWDQSYVIWYLHLAIATTMSNQFFRMKKRELSNY